jgi:hypothetical protein
MSMNSQTGQHTGSNCENGLPELMFDVSVTGYSSTLFSCAIDSCHGYVPLNGDDHVGE